MTRRLVVCTRSGHKLREILDILPPLPGLEIISLDQAGISHSPGEEGIEAFDTFQANALAKARYFEGLCGLPVLADDSGLCVDALKGRPGVHSKRFSGRNDLSGLALDQANNEHLLHALSDVDSPHRSAQYICVIAIRTPAGTEDLFHGSVRGFVTDAPEGVSGFGYDPYFHVPELGRTFGMATEEEKNELSHRGRALRAALPRLLELARKGF